MKQFHICQLNKMDP